MDIVIVLDGSNSIYPWAPMNEFLRKLIPALDIGPKNTQVTSRFIDGEIQAGDDLVVIVLTAVCAPGQRHSVRR